MVNMPLCLLCSLLLIGFSGFSTNVFGHDCAKAEHAILNAKQAQANLQAHSPVYQSENDNYTLVPPLTQKALQAFKNALVAAIDARLSCIEDIDDARLTQILNTTLANQSMSDSKGAAVLYGAHLDIEARRSTHQKPLLFVRALLGISCGSDNILLGYAWDRGRWKRVLNWQSGEYDTISGAYGDFFDFVHLPHGEVVIAHGTPWCTSRLSRIALDVLIPGDAQSAQQHIWHQTYDYYRDDLSKTSLNLHPSKNAFELHTVVSMLDIGIMTRKAIFSFEIQQGQLHRIQPLADNVRDFVDAWLQLEAPLAQRWSNQNQSEALMQSRQQLLALSENAELSYGRQRLCKNAPGQHELEVFFDSDIRLPNGNFRYISVRQQDSFFTVESISTTSNPACIDLERAIDSF